MILRSLLVILAVFGSLQDPAVSGPFSLSDPETSSCYELSFRDEFNVDRPNPGGGWHTSFAQWGGLRTLADNAELQLYVDERYLDDHGLVRDLNPFAQRAGALRITARRTPREAAGPAVQLPYLSGVVTSRHAQTYGFFEVRARLPRGQGLWPAFWLVGTGKHGHLEIDVFEMLSGDPTAIYQTVHAEGDKTTRIWRGTDTADGFHVYGLAWTRHSISWYVDGVRTFETDNAIHVPMYAILNLAVGGDWGGAPVSDSVFPATMEVDYFRAYVWHENKEGCR